METTLILATGRKGSGKSTMLRSLVGEVFDLNTRAVIWDNTREWSEPADLTEGQLERLEILPSHEFSVEDAARRALELAPAILVVDELDRVLPNGMGQSWGLKMPNLYSIIHAGRHYRTALFCAVRRFQNVHQDVVALADVVYVFRTTRAGDVDRLTREFGALGAQARELPPHEYVRIEL